MSTLISRIRSLNAGGALTILVICALCFLAVALHGFVGTYFYGSTLDSVATKLLLFTCGLGFVCVLILIVNYVRYRNVLFGLSSLSEKALVILDDLHDGSLVTNYRGEPSIRTLDVFNELVDRLMTNADEMTFSDSRFRALSDNAPIGVFFRNDAGKYEYTNARWHDITGITHSDSFVSYVNVKDLDRYNATLCQVPLEKKTHVIEFKFQNPSRGERILMEYISHVIDEYGSSCFMGSLVDVTELKIAQSELEKHAFYDPLTNLPNRRFFRDYLDLAMAKSKKENSKIAFYMTDLDEFKKVNDSLGHTSGDTLLIDISKKLSRAISATDVISRFGGDEFIILVGNGEDRRSLDNKAGAILDSMSAAVGTGASDIQITGSVGIAIYPDDATTPEELFRCAELALYDAKATGGNCFSYFSHALDKNFNEKIQMENKLRGAIKDDLLEVYLQPQYLSSTKRIQWAEALVRWKDADCGVISPDKFIPLAEETGLIFDIGDLVLDKVLSCLSRNNVKLAQLGVQGISVNLSGRQFFDVNFIEKLKSKFCHYNVSPELIELEITETTVMDDVDKAVEIMDSLRSIGCRLSIDDFGTGYSSLSYLKKFPITSLKIDRSFIRDIPDDENDVEISCAIIALAHNLGLSVVAEGVETETQAQFMAKQNCEFVQGFYFDRPMPLSAFLGRVPSFENEAEVASDT